jgi:hypothetical protein
MNSLLMLIPFFFLMDVLTTFSALLLPEHVWLIAMSLSYFYIAWGWCKRSIRSRPTRLYDKIHSELQTIAAINVPPSESVELKAGETVKFKTSSKAGKIIVTDKAIYHKKGFFFPVKRYDYSEVLCAFTDAFFHEPRSITVVNCDPTCAARGLHAFKSADEVGCPSECEEKVEEYYGGWVWGSVKILLWNGKIVTVYSILFTQNRTAEGEWEELTVTEELEEAVWRGIKVLLHGLCPYVPCYDYLPRSVWATVAKMAEKGWSRELIKRTFQAMMNDPIYRIFQ